MDAFAQLLEREPKLVAVAHVSNVLGTDEPDRRDRPHGARRRRAGAGRRRPGGAAYAVDVQALGVDFFAVTGHKLYGPTGMGALWGGSSCSTRCLPFSAAAR